MCIPECQENAMCLTEFEQHDVKTCFPVFFGVLVSLWGPSSVEMQLFMEQSLSTLGFSMILSSNVEKTNNVFQ